MSSPLSSARLDPAGTLVGLKRMAPISLFTMAFGLAFGVAALHRGLSGLEAVMMSGLVFAGPAQFAVLEMWGPEIPLVALIATTFAINARHLVMGAAIYPWLRHLPPRQRYLSLTLLSDSNWAMAATDYQRGDTDNVGMLVGAGLALWLAWLIGTLLGVVFSSGITEPERFGLDVIMSCFLMAMLMTGKRDLWVLLPWSVAALTTLAALKWLPANAHVIVGALAGGAVGLLMPPRPTAREAVS
ncbi:AzlC family ABC transporter permease [Halomonas sp. YLGW01]|uniref:AzlC family ABC transporter permease n=1 Tax=Halomonas sp. YLGW01 TaxID=2773308 RepID=UPI001786E4DC|nr:AzlC family ABC transporter permease [Halomonas sp. YLGW01]